MLPSLISKVDAYASSKKLARLPAMRQLLDMALKTAILTVVLFAGRVHAATPADPDFAKVKSSVDRSKAATSVRVKTGHQRAASETGWFSF